MSQFSRHCDNVIGKTLLSWVAQSVRGQLLKNGGHTRLLPATNFIGEPTAWGPPEFRLSFLYAGDVSEREVRVIEYAGADFFGVRYLLKDGTRTDHFVPAALDPLQQRVVSDAIHRFFMTGSNTVEGYDALVSAGVALRQVWMDAVNPEAQAA
jgi:hypothetical protein